MIDIYFDEEELGDLFYKVKINRFGNFREVLRTWQRYMDKDQRKRFNALKMGGEYDEVFWPYFAESTIKKGYRKKKGKIKYGDAIMRDTDTIYNSFRNSPARIKNNELVIYLQAPEYAIFHQNGNEETNLPQRKFLHVSERNAAYLMRLISSKIGKGSAN